ncbi:MAG: HAMP domain-containing protein [Candidatus Nitrohelix vancouverensis]|uniref:histidine kinase n=1 Tax=Candidatus Nitrohelix vancouverensis TaxID=2705534 RepID=A0A7T0G3J6_9BACT|nr:MAG: HAMP domain-containing protein [Candidatus Nitrohelix vancouverensis]
MSSKLSTSNSPTLEEPASKRRRARRTLLIILALLTGLTTLEIYFLQKDVNAPISNNIAVLALFNIILILLFLMIVLIVRNLVKLYNERKSKTLGSRFRTKLIIAFLVLALVPSTLLFFVASKLFSYSVGSWFNIQVEETLHASMEIAREHYSYLEKNALSKTRKIERFINTNRLYPIEKRNELHSLIAQKMSEYDLGAIVVFDSAPKIVDSEIHSSLSSSKIIAQLKDIILNFGKEDSNLEFQSTTLGNYLAIALPLTQQGENGLRTWGYIVTLSPFSRAAHSKISSIQNTYEDYKRQSFLKLPVTANYYTTFLMITLLILFSAIWLGIYIARGITVPIQQLAEGTRKIAEGDLNFKIDVQVTDEIGILVESFNNMTDELNESREKVEQINEELKAGNIELESRRSYIASILENIGAGVVSIDKRGRITTFNKAAEQILKVSMQEVLGTRYKETLSPAFRLPVRKMIKAMNGQQKEFWEEQVDLRVGENSLSLLVNIQALKNPGWQYMGIVIVFEDLTQMIKSQKIAAWKEVAQGIAHEIKNPLTPIQLNTQRLRKKFYEDKKGFNEVFEESISIIAQEVEGMKELLNEFLRFSRMPTPQPKPTSLHKLIEDVAAMYSGHERLVKFRKNFDPNITLMQLDAEQMRRVFINLFDNALDAVDEDGEIHITTRMTRKPDKVRIEFSDNGGGIAPQDRDKLFIPHFTTKNRGTGLGLAIVNRIIADHNGIIQVQDNHPKGTLFLIELPMVVTVKASAANESAFSKTTSLPF